jgi:AcrR family transcriptional regulator
MDTTNKKYIALMAGARELFWKHGFKRVSVTEICQKAGISKMTFYRFFANKTELAKAIFDLEVSKGQKQFKEIIQSEGSPAEKLSALLLLKFESTRFISPEFLNDFYLDTTSDLKEFVENKTREAWEVLKEDYKKGMELGLFRKDVNLDLLIRVQYHMVDLTDDKDLASLYPNRQDLIMDLANLFIYGVVPHD